MLFFFFADAGAHSTATSGESVMIHLLFAVSSLLIERGFTFIACSAIYTVSLFIVYGLNFFCVI